MKTPIRVRALTDDQRDTVEAGLRSSDASVLRRCQIGAAVDCSDLWVRDVVHAFNADGPVSLQRRSRRPHTIRVAIDAAGCERLRELLHRSPRDCGKPTSVWTLSLLAEVAAEEGITSEWVSHETIRNTAKRTMRRLKRRRARRKAQPTRPKRPVRQASASSASTGGTGACRLRSSARGTSGLVTVER